jgi:hypothetical protein
MEGGVLEKVLVNKYKELRTNATDEIIVQKYFS